MPEIVLTVCPAAAHAIQCQRIKKSCRTCRHMKKAIKLTKKVNLTAEQRHILDKVTDYWDKEHRSIRCLA